MFMLQGKGVHRELCEKATQEEVPNVPVAAIVIVVVMDIEIFLPLGFC